MASLCYSFIISSKLSLQPIKSHGVQYYLSLSRVMHPLCHLKSNHADLQHPIFSSFAFTLEPFNIPPLLLHLVPR